MLVYIIVHSSQIKIYSNQSNLLSFQFNLVSQGLVFSKKNINVLKQAHYNLNTKLYFLP
jgi:hypothetical protein